MQSSTILAAGQTRAAVLTVHDKRNVFIHASFITIIIIIIKYIYIAENRIMQLMLSLTTAAVSCILLTN